VAETIQTFLMIVVRSRKEILMVRMHALHAMQCRSIAAIESTMECAIADTGGEILPPPARATRRGGILDMSEILRYFEPSLQFERVELWD